MFDRRHFLKTSALVSLAPTLPTFLTRTAFADSAARSDDGRILVVIQLSGGNDGINTVVPYTDEGYEKYRTELRLPEKDLLKLTDEFAFNPGLRSASSLFEEGRLSVVHGVGYPNPNRSHFESMAIWHAGDLDAESQTIGKGWLGDAISLQRLAAAPHAIHVGDDELPVALRGRRCTATTISSPADLQLKLKGLGSRLTETTDTASLRDFVTKRTAEAFSSAKELAEATKTDSSARYPGSELANQLKLVSQIIKSGAAARVYYTSQSGYDTHAVQLGAHRNLLGTLSSSLKAFMDDMRASGLEDRVMVMAFSEFGRRVKENDSLGTDHGTAGPVLLAGTQLTKRSFGTIPSLMDLDGGDLKYTTDFRDVYASVIKDWLGLSLPANLKGRGQ